MMIELDSLITQAKDIEDLKPLLLVMMKALNRLDEARTQIRGDLMFHDSGPVLRCNDGKYYRLTLVLSGGVPVIQYTVVGTSPTGE